jgi:hypothetical protein
MVVMVVMDMADTTATVLDGVGVEDTLQQQLANMPTWKVHWYAVCSIKQQNSSYGKESEPKLFQRIQNEENVIYLKL